MGAMSRLPAALLLCVGLGLLAMPDCQPSRAPGGFHSANVVIRGTDFGVTWASASDGQRIFFGELGDDGWSTPQRGISKTGHETDPPLIASDGHGYMLAWTHHGGRKSGIWARALDPQGHGEAEIKVADGPAHLCRSMVWDGVGYVVLWIGEEGLYLRRLVTQQASEARVLHGDPGLYDCRLAWTGERYAVLYALLHDGGDSTLELLTFSGSGDDARATMIAIDDAPLRAREMVWNGSELVIAYTQDGAHGAFLAHADQYASDVDTQPVTGMNGHVRGIGIAPTMPYGVVWSTSERANATRGDVFAAVMNDAGNVGEPLKLTERANGRPVVNASGKGDRFAFGWSTDYKRGGGMVSWRAFRLRQDQASLRDATLLFATD